MKQKTAMQSMIEWAKEKAYFDDNHPDGFIDIELMEKKFKEWLEEERKQIEDAYVIGRDEDWKNDVYKKQHAKQYFEEMYETEQT